FAHHALLRLAWTQRLSRLTALHRRFARIKAQLAFLLLDAVALHAGPVEQRPNAIREMIFRRGCVERRRNNRERGENANLAACERRQGPGTRESAVADRRYRVESGWVHNGRL